MDFGENGVPMGIVVKSAEVVKGADYANVTNLLLQTVAKNVSYQMAVVLEGPQKRCIGNVI